MATREIAAVVTTRARVQVELPWSCAHCGEGHTVLTSVDVHREDIALWDSPVTVACKKCRKKSDLELVAYTVSREHD